MAQQLEPQVQAPQPEAAPPPVEPLIPFQTTDVFGNTITEYIPAPEGAEPPAPPAEPEQPPEDYKALYEQEQTQRAAVERQASDQAAVLRSQQDQQNMDAILQDATARFQQALGDPEMARYVASYQVGGIKAGLEMARNVETAAAELIDAIAEARITPAQARQAMAQAKGLQDVRQFLTQNGQQPPDARDARISQLEGELAQAKAAQGAAQRTPNQPYQVPITPAPMQPGTDARSLMAMAMDNRYEMTEATPEQKAAFERQFPL